MNVPDSNSLDLTTGMTLEAWVKPTLANTAWQTVVMKEQPGNRATRCTRAPTPAVPTAEVVVGGTYRTLVGPAPTAVTSTWTHSTATYDGSTLRLYVNGTQVAQLARPGAIVTSTGALRIGGNTVWARVVQRLDRRGARSTTGR